MRPLLFSMQHFRPELRRLSCFALVALTLAVSATTARVAGALQAPPFGRAAPADEAPHLSGLLVFQRWGKTDRATGIEQSDLLLYDFGQQKPRLLNISRNWPIKYPRNAHISPDKTQLLFMGIDEQQKPGEKGTWDVFLWTIGSRTNPVNLTQSQEDGMRNEDPKFSPDGTMIVLKRGPRGQGRIYTLDGNNKLFPVVGTRDSAEYSAPFYLPLTPKGEQLIAYFKGAAEKADLFMANAETGRESDLATLPDIQEYYPVHWKGQILLYVRWDEVKGRSERNPPDQIYSLDTQNLTADPARLSFNDDSCNNSDPYPVDDRYVLFSRDTPNTPGAYDLYLGDSRTGTVWTMAELGAPELTTDAPELGVAYAS